jgi:hypothetical protein
MTEEVWKHCPDESAAVIIENTECPEYVWLSHWTSPPAWETDGKRLGTYWKYATQKRARGKRWQFRQNQLIKLARRGRISTLACDVADMYYKLEKQPVYQKFYVFQGEKVTPLEEVFNAK